MMLRTQIYFVACIWLSILALIRFGNGCVVTKRTLSNMSIKSHLVLFTEDYYMQRAPFCSSVALVSIALLQKIATIGSGALQPQLRN